VKKVIGYRLFALYMDDLTVLLFMGSLVFFTAWLSWLTNKLRNVLDSVDTSGADIEEIRDGVELVAQILHKLPDLMPSFTMATSPLQPLVEAFAQNIMGQQPLRTHDAPRDLDGRYIGTRQEEKEQT
jgi:hypothetical protein